MVKKLADNLKIPVCCKIRILPEREKTLALVKGIEEAGCSILTVHGRTKEQNKHTMGSCDWEIIKTIKETVKIPVFANGGIHKFNDIVRCFEQTGVDGVMSAESLLENPALFSGEVYDLDDLALEYYNMWKKYDSNNPAYLKPHLFKIMHKGLSEHTDLRDKLGSAHKEEEIVKIVIELKERRKTTPKEQKFGWYERYQTYKPQTNGTNGSEKLSKAHDPDEASAPKINPQTEISEKAQIEEELNNSPQKKLKTE